MLMSLPRLPISWLKSVLQGVKERETKLQCLTRYSRISNVDGTFVHFLSYYCSPLFFYLFKKGVSCLHTDDCVTTTDIARVLFFALIINDIIENAKYIYYSMIKLVAFYVFFLHCCSNSTQTRSSCNRLGN